MIRSVIPPGERDLSDEDLERLYRHPGTGRHVRANFVATLDGAVEVDGRSGSLGSGDDLRTFATLRALADVVLVGGETARRENYGPARLSPARRERRQGRGQGAAPAIAVITARAGLDPGARLFTDNAAGPRPLVLTCEAADPQRLQALAARADVVLCGDRTVDLPTALDALGARGWDRVLCEGGPSVLTQLMSAGLLDELCLTHALLVAGPGRHPLTSGASFTTPVPVRLEHLLAGEAAMLARYRIEKVDRIADEGATGAPSVPRS